MVSFWYGGFYESLSIYFYLTLANTGGTKGVEKFKIGNPAFTGIFAGGYHSVFRDWNRIVDKSHHCFEKSGV